MRRLFAAALLVAFAGLAAPASAQVFNTETPAPAVTAAGASWQLNREPIFYAGTFYDPSGPVVFFDGKVMVRTGVYDTVPLYEDATLQPYSVVFVPVGGLLMRPYVRESEFGLHLTPTTGRFSYPTFPSDVRESRPFGAGFIPEGYAMVPISTLGTVQRTADVPAEPPFTAVGAVSVAFPLEVGPQLQGAWIEFDQSRWFSSGRAVNYDAGRFISAGDYRGFPVYRERGGTADRIFVTVVHDGPVTPVAPYDRR
jgi:hypothetical protein